MEHRQNFEGNRGTKTILGNRKYKKQIFDFLGTGEQANLFQGNKGTGTPWEGLSKRVAIKKDKMLDKPHILSLSPNRLINSI